MKRTCYTMVERNYSRLIAIFALFVLSAGSGVLAQTNNKRNVLLIVVDDLRPELGVYQRPDHVLRFNSPNMDKFAESALLFDRAYVNYGSCNPSRNSMFTGFRPETLGLVSKDTLTSTLFYRNEWGKSLHTIPTRMRTLGFNTVGIGKIFHQERAKDFNSYKKMDNQNLNFCPAKDPLFCTVNAQSTLVDHKVATNGVNFLKKQNPQSGKPFFLILGFHRPHVAYSVPTWGFDKIDMNQLHNAMENPASDAWYSVDGIPANANPPSSKNQFPLMLAKSTAEAKKSSTTVARSLKERQWYAAAVYWVDFCIGRVLTALDESKLKDDTMVILLGDNGVELGEYGAFAKSSPFETTSRVPLMFRVPWMPQTQGKRTSSIFEGVDLGSTILELLAYDSASNGAAVGRLLSASDFNAYTNNSLEATNRNLMDIPSNLLGLGEGNSQLGLFTFYNSAQYRSLKDKWSKEPNQNVDPNLYCHKCFAVTTNGRCRKNPSVFAACETLNRDDRPDNPPYLVFSMRSPTHRYIEIRATTLGRFAVDWTNAGLMGRVLLSHENDNGLVGMDGSEFERTNLAPCTSCELKSPRVVVIEDYRLPPLLQDHGQSPASFFPPELDTLSPNIALLVAQHQLMLRSIIRDKSPACSGHGLPLVSGDCKCYAPWSGKKCDQAQGNVFSNRPSTSAPTTSPTTSPPFLEFSLGTSCFTTPGVLKACASYAEPCNLVGPMVHEEAASLCAKNGTRLCVVAELKPKRKLPASFRGYDCATNNGAITSAWYWTRKACKNKNKKGFIMIRSNGKRTKCGLTKNNPKANLICCQN